MRALLGRSVLTHSLDTTDPHLAAVRAKPILLKWRAQIAAARRLALAFQQARKALDECQDDARDDIIQHVIRNYAPQNVDVERVTVGPAAQKQADNLQKGCCTN